ncbi:MAG TPA: thioesterase domain-containing protein [Mucilaginibacter sp.]|jgi:surfactin synthase thioesterase subunit
MKKKINLLCLSFAGGNKYSYRTLFDKAPSFLNIMPLEYPGRGTKITEHLVSDIHILVNELYGQVKEIADKEKYAVYGHSLGGLVAYLLTLKLMENRHRQPEHLFITGTDGPSSLSRLEKKRSLLPKDEFIKEIKDLGGMPNEILESEELLDYLEPILRNDFRVSETYLYEDRGPLNIPITVITGSEEDMEEEDVLLWQKESYLPVDFSQMPGGHFFILEHKDKLLEIISEKLTKHLIYC